MSFWDWLFGEKKEGYLGASVQSAPAFAPPPGPPPGMQQIQLTMPAAVPTSYGIQRAIELMRDLPIDEDPALVLRVVRKTLRSTGVSLEEIVRTATDREVAVIKGIESDRAAIEQLEIQIATRRSNITRLETDLDETRTVRARIEEALETETHVGVMALPPDVVRARDEAAAAAKSKPPPLPKPGVPAPPASEPSVAKPPSPAGPIAPPKVGAPIVGSKPPPKLPSAFSPSLTKRDGATPESKSPAADPKASSAKAADAKPIADPTFPDPKSSDAKPPDAKSDATDATNATDATGAKPPDPRLETKPGSESKETTPTAGAVTRGRGGPRSSVPDLGEIDDGFDETTATREIAVSGEDTESE